MPKVFKDVPIESITLRKFEKPKGDLDNLIRKFCLSIGILQPGDSRDIIVDILKIILTNKKVTTKEICRQLKKKGASEPNVRRHLLRLRKIGIIQKNGNIYQLKENLSLEEILEEYIVKFLINPILDRIREYARAIDSSMK